MPPPGSLCDGQKTCQVSVRPLSWQLAAGTVCPPREAQSPSLWALAQHPATGICHQLSLVLGEQKREWGRGRERKRRLP